jgi:multisubunit Na+/H+ antiporter MnhB subunit
VTGLLVVGAALVLVIIAGAIWWRRSSHDARHDARDSHLLTPPPSPYAPSQGFRLVDGESAPAPATRPTPARPRLDARDYVFGDASPTGEDSLVAMRHGSNWALERTARRRRRKWRSRQWMRLGVVVLVVALAAGYALQRGRTATTTTTTTAPTHFVATSTGPHSAKVVARANDVVTITATGALDIVVRDQAGSVFHGSLASGHSTSATLTTTLSVRVNSLALSVKVGNAPVSLPAGAVAPYTVTFTVSK